MSLELNWPSFPEPSEEILTREDRDKIGALMFEKIEARVPVRTGKLKGQLKLSVLKRRVRVRSKLFYTLMVNKKRPFFHITPTEANWIDATIEQAADRYLARFGEQS